MTHLTLRLLAPLTVLALFAAAAFALTLNHAAADGHAADEAAVLARLAENRRVEFALHIAGQTLLPERRFVSLDRGPTPWLRSSPVQLPNGRDASVVARRIDDGRFEWALRIHGLDDDLRPADRYIPPLRSFSRWLSSAPVAVPPLPCCEGEQRLKLGFFAFFAPISYSADSDPDSAGFHRHSGYEAALINALETMDYTELSFERIPISEWPDIWLSPTTPEIDIAAGGITILESRTRDHDGRLAIAFTDGHIALRQTLLVRTADADRIRTHADLTSDDRIGAVPGTTGEARLLQLTGLADDNGILAAGAQIETPNGSITADGTDAYIITSAEQTPNMAGRTRIIPPNDRMPQVVYMGNDDAEYIAAVIDGRLDGLGRGELGNTDAAVASEGALAVTAYDPAVEHAGFSLPIEDADLLACLNARLNWLTDHRQIGYPDWVNNPNIFTDRANAWNARY